MRVLLADDHAIMRSGLARIISDAFPGVILGEAGSCEEVREKVRQASWSIVVLDIALGDRNSLHLVPELKRLAPGLPIVVLSMHKERPFVLRALRAGVSGYVTKDRAPEELLQGIRSALRGQRYVSQDVAQQIAEYVALGGSTSGAPHQLLSQREYEVLLQIAAGRSVSEIATQLGLSIKTVSTYRTRLLEKMGLSSNAQLIRYALQQGLVP